MKFLMFLLWIGKGIAIFLLMVLVVMVLAGHWLHQKTMRMKKKGENE